MQVLDQRRHHLAEARIGRTLDLGEHRLGDVVRTLDDHGFLPLYSLTELICLPARLLNPQGQASCPAKLPGADEWPETASTPTIILIRRSTSRRPAMCS